MVGNLVILMGLYIVYYVVSFILFGDEEEMKGGPGRDTDIMEDYGGFKYMQQDGFVYDRSYTDRTISIDD